MNIEHAISSSSIVDERNQTKNLSAVFSVVLLVCISFCVLIFQLESYPRIWFDEGYKLNSAYTVVRDGVYATYTTDGYVPFDPGTSGGPADILPAALAIKLLGTTVLAGRLTSVLYTLLASISLYLIGRYLWGEIAGLFCALLVIAAPPINQVSFIVIGRQGLSEATAFSLMIFGICILSYAWRTRSLQWGIVSGVVMGLGMLSKSQIAISLVPALFVVASWRWWRERKGLLYLFAPVVVVVGVFVVWMLIGRIFTPLDIRQQNSAMLIDAIKTNIFTTLFGSNLDRRALVVIGIMLLGAITSAWRIWRTRTISESQWIEILLVLFVVSMTIWFAVFSIGWVRYAYAGLVIGTFFIARFIWGILAGFFTKWDRMSVGLLGIVVVVALGINFFVTSSGVVPDDAQETARYIATSIPKEAVIETWEWELDMLSEHRQMHHPQQSFLFEAIRQSSHHRLFNLTYEALQANPDYLIVGTFGAWTGIYSPAELNQYFVQVAEFGVYHVYKRINKS